MSCLWEGASAPNGTMKCRGHGVPEMVTPAMRTTAVLLSFLFSFAQFFAQFCSVFQFCHDKRLGKWFAQFFSFAMTSGLASDLLSFSVLPWQAAWQVICSVFQFCHDKRLGKWFAQFFSFAMTSGLASDSDKFKIIITLRRAQKFGDTGFYKNFIFLNNPLTVEFFFKFELNAICPIYVPYIYKGKVQYPI